MLILNSFLLVIGTLALKVSAKPNVVVIITDDQDVFLNGLKPMENSMRLLLDRGIMFWNAFTPNPLCCPSRASMLTGMYCHNHATINNSISGGCYDDYWKDNIENHALPVFMEEAGYKTFYAGKYLNQYFSQDIPPGWTNWYGMHGSSKYYNYTLNENGVLKKYEDEYFTDVIKNKSINFIEDMKNGNEPFFAIIAPTAPHSPYTPAPRHASNFSNVEVLRTPNFNLPAGDLDKHWLLRMEPKVLPENIVDSLNDIYRNRWRALLAVDELITEIIDTLVKTQQLDNTYLVFTSDNGYHIGQFAQAFDKRQPYETDIRVPLIVMGPSITNKDVNNFPVSLIDIFPTVLDLAGIPIPTNIDGVSFKPNLEGTNKLEFNRLLLVEHWGEGNDKHFEAACPWPKEAHLKSCSLELGCHCQDARNNTYACLRHISQVHNKIYCEFSDDENFVEAYDLDVDPYQMVNQGFDWPPSQRAQYEIILSKMVECIGNECNVDYY